MSAFATLWSEPDSDGWDWTAVHDGDCKRDGGHHGRLSDVLAEVEACLDFQGMRWEISNQENGLRLKGWPW